MGISRYLAIAISIRRAARWTGDSSWPWQWRPPPHKPFSKYKSKKKQDRDLKSYKKLRCLPIECPRLARCQPPVTGHPAAPCCLCWRPTYLHNVLNISNFLLELSSYRNYCHIILLVVGFTIKFLFTLSRRPSFSFHQSLSHSDLPPC